MRVLLFAAAREVVGARDLSLSLAEGAVARDVLDALCAAHPGLRGHRGSLRLAVEGEYAAEDVALREGVEVAVIPPVAGG
ncbi:MAG: MoaD/ThiS family protein [Polyangiales bacterium]